MKDGKVRVGIIGCGSWTVSSHIPNLLARSDVELVVVNRQQPDALLKVQRTFGFPYATTNFMEVFRYELDVVVIGSPASFHYEHAKASLEANVHVLCEKPFTVTAAQAWELVELAQRKKLHLLIANGWNYKSMVIEAKRLMDEQGVGDIEAVMVHMASSIRELLLEGVYSGAPAGFDSNARTWIDPSLSGGGYAQAQLSHGLALGLWLTGLRGEEIFARVHHAGGQVDLHDAYNLTYSNGAIGTVFGASYPAGVSRHQLEVRIFGSKGQLVMDLERERLWIYHSQEKQTVVDLIPGEGAYDCKGPVDAIIDLAQGKDVPNLSPGELAARTVEITEAAYRSTISGRSEKISK